MNGFIRIIAGKWRGRKLPVLDKEGLRPTTDRVKETLFNWLMPIIQDASCLDCFAGSGSLGFEATSRGAKRIVLLEKDKHAAQQLSKNKMLLKDEAIEVNNIDTLTWLAQSASQQFNLVFIDPPFKQGLVEKAIQLLEQNGWLQSTAYIYIESEVNHNMSTQLPVNWHVFREKKAGQVNYSLFIREKA